MEFRPILKKFLKSKLFTVIAILILALVIFMSYGGLNLTGKKSTAPSNDKISMDKITVSEVKNGTQTVTMSVGANGYSPDVLVVQKDIPTKWIINVDELNYCNQTLAVPFLGKLLTLKEGRNEITFTPVKSIQFNCSMWMLHGYIKVVDNIQNVNLVKIKKEVSEISFEKLNISSCCGY